MNFKTIKNLPQSEFDNLYEMSQDGLVVRRLNTEINLLSEGRVVLLSEAGNQKMYGAKSMYRRSWMKPLPYDLPEEFLIKKGTSVKSSEKKAEKVSVKKEKKVKVPKKSKSIFKVRKGSLLSEFNRTRLLEAVKGSEERKNNFIEYVDNKVTIRGLLKNENSLLLRLESSQISKNGLWFYNLETHEHVRFEKEIHKPSYGDKSIVWPTW